MKKFIAFALAAVLLSCLFVSCGEYRFEYMKEDLTPYITAGEYLNLTVTIPAADEVTDEDVEEKIAEKIAKYSTTEPVDRACKLGDTVNIDFVGRVDGAEFEGGTASDQELVLGEAGYIEGFEDAIVGMSAGEKRTIDVTFPEDYGNEQLNGKPAQFDITMNTVSEVVSAVLTDEIAKELGADSVEDYRKQIRTELEDAAAETLEKNKNKYAWTAVVENCEFKAYPEKAVAHMANSLYEYYEAMYYQYIHAGLTLENLGITKESCTEQAQTSIREELALYAIAKAGGYTVSDEEYEAKVAVLAEKAETDVKTYKSRVSRQNTETKVLYEKIMADVLSSATFVTE